MAWPSVLVVTLTILSLFAMLSFSISIRSPNRNVSTEVLQVSTSSYSVNLSSLKIQPSFSFQFMFELGNGVALVIIPPGFPSKFATNMSFELLRANQFLGIEFYANVCKILSSKVNNNNISKNSNVLEDGVILTSCIDYQPTSNQLDVRVTKLYDPKPVEPLISQGVDFGEVLKGEEVVLGLVSSKEQNTSAYLWSSEIEDSQNGNCGFSFGFNSPGDLVSANPQEHTISKKKDGLLLGFIVSIYALFAIV